MPEIRCSACAGRPGRGKRAGTACGCGGRFEIALKSKSADLKSDLKSPGALEIARARISELEAEVARLKRELAGRPEWKPVPIPGALERAQRGKSKAEGDKVLNLHGARCMCIGCRSERSA